MSPAAHQTSEPTLMAIMASTERAQKVCHLSDADLARAILDKVWAKVSLFSEESDLLDEAIYRLKKGSPVPP